MISPFVREYFSNPSFNQVKNDELHNRFETTKIERNVLNAEQLKYEEEINELIAQFPEFEGRMFKIEKPFIKFKEFIRRVRLERGLSKHESLQNDKKELLNRIKLKSNKMLDYQKELKYREAFSQVSKLQSDEEIDPIMINSKSFYDKLKPRKVFYSSDEEERLKVSESYPKPYQIKEK